MSITPTIPMSADEARVATERIRLALDQVSTAWADLGERITDAYQRRADLALGYSSWAAYADAELRPSHELSADIRRELVGLLSAQGMSTRAIAPTVGVSKDTVYRDQVYQADTPAAHERIDPRTCEVRRSTVEAVRGSRGRRPPPARRDAVRGWRQPQGDCSRGRRRSLDHLTRPHGDSGCARCTP